MPAPPQAPALIAGPARAVWLSRDGELEVLSRGEAARRAQANPPFVCQARATAARLGVAPFRAYDLLALYAFVHPARFCLPTPGGLATALNLPPPEDAEACAITLVQAAAGLLADLAARDDPRGITAAQARTLARCDWSWGPAVLAALGLDADEAPHRTGLDVWMRLPEWSEPPPAPPPGEAPISDAEARERLVQLLGGRAEQRAEQADYAGRATHAFLPRDLPGMPNLVLAEAGTGIGKTLGYIAPASLWAERNRGTVWISTYTKNLQRQVDQELDRLYPDPRAKRQKAVVRKGRENYLCLLNFQDAVAAARGRAEPTIALTLMARWAEASRDGDMVGGDFPAWMADLLGRPATLSLTDQRGECIYSACPHYSRCYIEHSRRKSAHAELVIANHALVMIRAALDDDDAHIPTRYVFDEGHHLFDAADGAFSAHISGVEGVELRRWLLGPEGRRRSSRARGLEARLEDLAVPDQEAHEALREVLRAAHVLAASGWLNRLNDGVSQGPMESFLARVRQQVLARTDNARTPYSIEVSTAEPVPGLLEAADDLDVALEKLVRPLLALARHLHRRLDDEADELDTSTRVRIEAGIRSLKRRADTLKAWRGMLAALQSETPPEFVDWFGIERIAGRDFDIGMHRHWIDPTIPFAAALLTRAHGAVITSATLRDSAPEAPDDWASAEVRTGALHLPKPAERVSLRSPFDYPQRTRLLVVTDINRNDADQVAAAYRELFLAAGGGALGLFTAIQRLRAVHERIAPALEAANLPLYAQHIDAMDTGTLVDIFRAEEQSCLLGTDAVRDGVDVPGRALRLIVFDRVPWPRPDIMHRARKQAFGGSAYDDMIVRLRLKQAFGRLLRRADDRGVFVLLDRQLPSRLKTAFPPGVEVERVGLADCVARTAEFLNAMTD